MIDEMWLPVQKIKTILGDTSWVLDCDHDDAVTVRLREEITHWLGFPLYTRASALSEKKSSLILLRQTAEISAVPGSYRIIDGFCQIVIEAADSVGLLYGFYAFIRQRLEGRSAGSDPVCSPVSVPEQRLRMIDHWDQIDGSVERGYAGESIFFGCMNSNDHSDFRTFPERDTTDPFRGDFSRLEKYARYMASIGINAVCLNNVNVRGDAAKLIVQPFLSRVSVIARLFSSFGIKTFLSINFAAPKKIGGLVTCDPLEDQVISWWSRIVDHIYEEIPDFGGFVVKADSEGEPGPMQYGCAHAQGANMLGRLLKTYGGLVIWRSFVYNSHQDWRDRSTDRAMAAYETFQPLDGEFDDNVILQVKFGPIDFQTAEPINPLILAMKHTQLMVEFQITAEYLGHQIDINYVLPQWLSLAKRFPPCMGFAGVSNVGMDENWTGNKLAQANLYGFGRMCWDSSLTEDGILDEWIDLSFPDADEETVCTVRFIMSTSNQTYKEYTAPLGVGFMVVPGAHYGPSVDGYEFDRWGTYHFADRDGIGVDRTIATGSGYTAQYPQPVREHYEKLKTTEDDLLLFFHHVSYTYVLHNGKTVIQHIYDTHFHGCSQAEKYCALWDGLKGRIDEESFENVRERLMIQKNNAHAWRDQVNTFFYRMTKIPDESGRNIDQ